MRALISGPLLYTIMSYTPSCRRNTRKTGGTKVCALRSWLSGRTGSKQYFRSRLASPYVGHRRDCSSWGAGGLIEAKGEGGSGTVNVKYWYYLL